MPPIDDRRFVAGLARLRAIGRRTAKAKAHGGILGGLRRAGLAAAAAAIFVRLYLLPQEENAMPASPRLQPVW